MIKHRANLRTNCLEPREQCDRRWPPVHICLDGYIAFSLDIGDLLQQQFDAGEFAQQRRPQSTWQRSPVACHQPVKPGWGERVERDTLA